jgi:hypothetical protein
VQLLRRDVVNVDEEDRGWELVMALFTTVDSLLTHSLLILRLNSYPIPGRDTLPATHPRSS